MTPETPDRLEATLAHAKKDGVTVEADGTSLRRYAHGVTLRPLTTHVDDRGSLTELFDERWGYPHPLVSANTFTIRPGVVKGWGLHKLHQDRYVVLHGEMEIVMYDPRPDSPTCGEVSHVYLSGANRVIVNVPEFVWHADRNIGSTDVLVVNFPTRPYDYENPDKYRLPLDTPHIPHRFPEGTVGN